MGEKTCYENYPLWIVAVANIFLLATYVLGTFLIYQFGPLWAGLYLIYILILELRLMGRHCVDCCYYGKFCAFGRGKLSAVVFRKGDPAKFAKMKLTWKSLIPDLIVTAAPVIAGILLLAANFSWLFLGIVTALILLGPAGYGFVRGSLACRYCKQKDLGCPAEQLFNKSKGSGAHPNKK
jgi:hypothetical protein